MRQDEYQCDLLQSNACFAVASTYYEYKSKCVIPMYCRNTVVCRVMHVDVGLIVELLSRNAVKVGLIIECLL